MSTMTALQELMELQKKVAATRDEENKKKEEAQRLAASAPATGQKQQDNGRKEHRVDPEVIPILQQVEMVLETIRELPERHPMRKTAWQGIDEVLATSPKAAAEFYTKEAERVLERYTGREISWKAVSSILKSGVAETIDRAMAEEIRENRKAYRAHKDGCKEKECAICSNRPKDVFWAKEPTGDNSQRDLMFVIKREKGWEFDRYAKRVYEALKDWQKRSYERKESWDAACEEAGVERGLTLADVAAGKVPGKTVVARIPHSHPFITKKNDREYSNHGGFFVRQLTQEEAAKSLKKSLSEGMAALRVSVPTKEISSMYYVLDGFKDDVYEYSVLDPVKNPFYGLQNKKGYSSNWGISLLAVLKHVLAGIRSGEEKEKETTIQPMIPVGVTTPYPAKPASAPKHEQKKDLPPKASRRQTPKEKGGAANLTAKAQQGEHEEK